MADNERSAIDTINEILEKINSLDKKVGVIETNIKLSNNKLSKINKSINLLMDKLDSFDSGRPPEVVIDKSGKEGPLVLGKIKTFGRIVDPSLKPIANVLVKLYNKEGDLIKTRNTDREGYWDVRLPPGSYSLEYIQKGFRPTSSKFELNDKMDSFEVK